MDYQKRIRIQVAAFHFAQGKSAEEIAALVDRSARQVWRYAEMPEWQQVLEMLNFTGDRSFRQQPTRQADTDKITYAHETYVQLLKDGTPPHKLCRATAEATGTNLSTIRGWERKYGWRETD